MSKVEIGNRFGCLEVKKDLGADKHRHHKYRCVCLSCGREQDVDVRMLRGQVHECKYCKSKSGDVKLPKAFVEQMI